MTKVFEVSPDGTVGLFERVQPITSREEFASFADDVFDLIWMLTKKYILADFGSKYFMNYGLRDGFGAVLLDFPYCYEPDGNKLICSAPDKINPQVPCGGLIDYDIGFNNLRCNKCGAIYRANQLAKLVKDQVIIRPERRNTMLKVKKLAMVNGKLVPVNSKSTDEEFGFREETPVIEHEKKQVITEQRTSNQIKVNLNQLNPVENKQVAAKEVQPKEDEYKNIIPTVHLKPINPVIKPNDKIISAAPQQPQVKPKVNFKQQAQQTSNRPISTFKKPNINNHKHQNNNFHNNSGNSVQITAITFDQLKDLKFSFSSIDNEHRIALFKSRFSTKTDTIEVPVWIDLDSLYNDDINMYLGYEDLSDELETAKRDLHNAEEKNAQLQEIIDSHQEAINEYLQKIDEYAKKISDLEDELATNNREDDEESTNIENINNELNERIESLNCQVEKYAGIIYDKDLTIESLKKKISELESKESSIADELNGVKYKLEELKTVRVANEATIVTLNNTIEEKDEKIKDLNSQLQEVKATTGTDNRDTEEHEPTDELYVSDANEDGNNTNEYSADTFNEEYNENVDDEYDSSEKFVGFTPINCNMYNIHDIANQYNIDAPENIGTNTVFLFYDKDDKEFLTDVSGRFVYVSSLKGYPIDKIKISIK